MKISEVGEGQNLKANTTRRVRSLLYRLGWAAGMNLSALWKKNNCRALSGVQPDGYSPARWPQTAWESAQQQTSPHISSMPQV